MSSIVAMAAVAPYKFDLFDEIARTFEENMADEHYTLYERILPMYSYDELNC